MNALHPPLRFGLTLFWAVVALSVLTLGGCEKKTAQRLNVKDTQQPTPRLRPCQVLLIGLEGLAQPLQRQWEARHDSALTVQSIEMTEFVDNDMRVDSEVNVLVYPADIMVELIDKKRIDPLDKSFYDSDEFTKFSFLTHYRKSNIRFAGQPYAAPCGGPMFTQVFRNDVIAQLGQSAPPETWKQFIRTAKKITDLKSASQPPNDLPTTIALPLKPGWAGHTFLAISSPYVRQFGQLSVLFDRHSMKPLLDRPGFVRALSEMKELVQASPESLQLGPQDVFEKLISGEAAIGLTWPSNISDSAHQANNTSQSPDAGDTNKKPVNQRSAIIEQLRVAKVPGSTEFFDNDSNRWTRREANKILSTDYHNIPGIMVSQVRSRGRKQAAQQFIAWVTDTEISALLFDGNMLSGPFRAAHLAKLDSWSSARGSNEFNQSWSQTLRDAHQNALIFKFPSIAGSRQYQHLLDQGIRNCLSRDDLSPQQALTDISANWESLTESIGRKKQIRLLKRNTNF